MSFISLSGGREDGTTSLANCLEVSYKDKHTPTLLLGNSIAGIYSTEMKSYVHKNICIRNFITAVLTE